MNAMSELPPCPKCASTYTYEDGGQCVCPECGHEWMPGQADGGEQCERDEEARHGDGPMGFDIQG